MPADFDSTQMQALRRHKVLNKCKALANEVCNQNLAQERFLWTRTTANAKHLYIQGDDRSVKILKRCLSVFNPESLLRLFSKHYNL